MWDGLPDTITTGEHRFKLVDFTTPPLQLAPYRAGPAVRDFEKKKSTQILEVSQIEPARTESVSSIVFGPIKDGTLQIFVNNRKVGGLRKRDLLPIFRTDEYILTTREKQLSSQYRMKTEDNGKTNSASWMKERQLFHFVTGLVASNGCLRDCESHQKHFKEP